ncbi:hypothetical protein NJT12_01960 [Flavobacterium sp. AC]|uniref:Lipoprotein n=1 Tax=Flavobacterium azizsancarii TaxID=2961580 RepID=A0ABT4W740_9FLAO|nr:hypothetical protein [Flavobacterium azizsancarii]MDA6068375.1 hypothetical protein [Flavobacterium azizsancarii]
MKLNKFVIIILASITVFASSCGSDTKKINDTDNTDNLHNNAEDAEKKDTVEKTNKYENELGQALDKNGKFITGCPSHKEMIGSKGDKCPKCNYMTMMPITWSLQGIDTVRVTSLSDYNPPVIK